MSTPNPDSACPALHCLHGTMGTDDNGQPLLPEHLPDAAGRCTHCGELVER